MCSGEGRTDQSRCQERMSVLYCLSAEFSGVWVRLCVRGKEGKVSRTCASHLEGSLRNDVHLFSDLWTPSIPARSPVPHTSLFLSSVSRKGWRCHCVCVYGGCSTWNALLLHYCRTQRNLNTNKMSSHSAIVCPLVVLVHFLWRTQPDLKKIKVFWSRMYVQEGLETVLPPTVLLVCLWAPNLHYSAEHTKAWSTEWDTVLLCVSGFHDTSSWVVNDDRCLSFPLQWSMQAKSEVSKGLCAENEVVDSTQDFVCAVFCSLFHKFRVWAQGWVMFQQVCECNVGYCCVRMLMSKRYVFHCLPFEEYNVFF